MVPGWQASNKKFKRNIPSSIAGQETIFRSLGATRNISLPLESISSEFRRLGSVKMEPFLLIIRLKINVHY